MINYLPKLKAKGTLTDKTYDALKKAIVELELRPGKLLLEEDLSEQLGVSRTPVHSALNRLAHEGLVRMIKGKGSIVEPLTEVQLTDLFAVRKALEGLAVRLCIHKASDEELKRIHYLLQWQKDNYTGAEVDMVDFLRSDVEFHTLLAKVANNAYLARQIEQILEMTRRYVIAYTADTLPPIVVEEHAVIYEQIRQRREKEAVALVEAHLGAVESRICTDIQAANQNRKLITVES